MTVGAGQHGLWFEIGKYKKEEIKKRVEEAASHSGLTELLDRKPADMSGSHKNV